MKNKVLSKEQKARKKVQALKNFYTHLAVFISGIFLLILFGNKIISFITAESSSEDFITWIYLNIVFTIVGWGIVVAVHALYVFGKKISFYRNWEERRINEYLEEKS